MRSAKMRSSLGVLLALCLAGLQFVAVLVVVSSSYFTSERALIAHARDLLRDVGTNAIEHSKGFLAPARGAAELAARLAENRIVASDDVYQLESLLFQQLQMTPQFSGVYFGDTDGDFVMVMRSDTGPSEFRSKLISHEGGIRKTEYLWRDQHANLVHREQDPADIYDPRDRSWFILASEKLTTIWTDPYIFFTSQQPGITLAAPVLDAAGAVDGVVGVDIEISRISTFLSGLKIGENGRALIIHRNGDVIAHPQPELLKARNTDGTLRFANIEEFDDPIARAAFGPLARAGQIPVSRETPAQFTYQGESYVSTMMPVISDILPWTIAVYAPEKDFTAVLKDNRLQNIWIAAAIAMLTGLVGLLLADWLHRPVRAFAVRSTLIAQGEIDPAQPAPRTYRELERANDTLVQQIAARREAEREYGQTFELSSRAMAQISPVDGSILRANAKFGEIVGVPPELTVGRKITDVAHPDDLGAYEHGPDSLSDPLPNQEMRWIRRDGTQIWVGLNMIVIRDDTGKPIHGVLTVDDITQDKARAQQIAQLSRDLSHLARGNTLGEMAAGLAHELNQPLTAIAQNAGTGLLALEQQDSPDPELIEIMTEIETQSIRAGEIIRALRGFIRKDEGNRAQFDFSELLEQTLRLVHAETVDARVQITRQIEPIPKIYANRVQIAQVLVNLLRNAIEVLITQDGPRRIHISAAREGDRVRVSVTDNGPGVDPSIALFTQFETSKPEGMGLGLSICRNIIEANGGSLWHKKVEPQGARFSFTVATT